MMACRLAIWPTRISPPLANATIDGQRLPPSAVGMTTGLPPWTTATTELVVPKSMPTILAIVNPPLLRWGMPVPVALPIRPECAMPCDVARSLSGGWNSIVSSSVVWPRASDQLIHRGTLRPLTLRVVRLKGLEGLFERAGVVRVFIASHAKVVRRFGSHSALRVFGQELRERRSAPPFWLW